MAVGGVARSGSRIYGSRQTKSPAHRDKPYQHHVAGWETTGESGSKGSRGTSGT